VDDVEDVKVRELTVLDIFHQGTHCGIPAHWCVQYIKVGSTFVDYEYFPTWTEAYEFAMSHDYND
jgi:hypothetical protein